MRLLTLLAGTFLLAACSRGGREAPSPRQMGTAITPAQIAWHDEGHGGQSATLFGDPSGTGDFIMRVRFPANHTIPRHHHPVDEYVTVISGTLFIALGPQADSASARALPPGGVFIAPTGTRIAGYTTAPVEIQIHGRGPFEMILDR